METPELNFIEEEAAYNGLKLTNSQAAVLRELEFFHSLKQTGDCTVAGVETRPVPLMIAPSGSGKTFLVRRLAARNKVPMFTVNVHNWIPRGAANSVEITMAQIVRFITENDRGFIFIDELNKLSRQHAAETSWSSSVLCEVIALLDCDTRLENMGFTGMIDHLRRNFFFVGAAAFQDEWSTTSRSVGFRAETNVASSRTESFEQAVRFQSVVPAELLGRFNDRLVVLPPPSATEFGGRIEEIRCALRLPKLDVLQHRKCVERALASGKMWRWLEGYSVECLRECSNPIARITDLDENIFDRASVPRPRISEKSSDSKWQEAKVLQDFWNSLERLSRAATRLEFAIAELDCQANSGPVDSGNRALRKLLHALTARFREITGCENVDIVRCLYWISKNAPRLDLAEDGVKRAALAHRIMNVATSLEDSLGTFRGSFCSALAGSAARSALVEFVVAVRESRLNFDLVRVVSQ